IGAAGLGAERARCSRACATGDREAARGGTLHGAGAASPASGTAFERRSRAPLSAGLRRTRSAARRPGPSLRESHFLVLLARVFVAMQRERGVVRAASAVRLEQHRGGEEG